MSDTDRLRAAADRLDELYLHLTGWSMQAVQSGPSTDCADATAALLRAVALRHSDGSCDCSTDLADDCCAAALALADVILGGAE